MFSRFLRSEFGIKMHLSKILGQQRAINYMVNYVKVTFLYFNITIDKSFGMQDLDRGIVILRNG